MVADVAGKEVSQVKEVSERIKKYYFGDDKPSEETLDSFIDVSIKETLKNIKNCVFLKINYIIFTCIPNTWPTTQHLPVVQEVKQNDAAV